MKSSVYIATSLDGFIARENGEIDWLLGSDPDGSGEDYGFDEFMASVDALVMGRHTFEQVLTFGDWPTATNEWWCSAAGHSRCLMRCRKR